MDTLGFACVIGNIALEEAIYPLIESNVATGKTESMIFSIALLLHYPDAMHSIHKGMISVLKETSPFSDNIKSVFAEMIGYFKGNPSTFAVFLSSITHLFEVYETCIRSGAPSNDDYRVYILGYLTLLFRLDFSLLPLFLDSLDVTAEKVSKILMKETQSWSRFYRVKGNRMVAGVFFKDLWILMIQNLTLWKRHVPNVIFMLSDVKSCTEKLRDRRFESSRDAVVGIMNASIWQLLVCVYKDSLLVGEFQHLLRDLAKRQGRAEVESLARVVMHHFPQLKKNMAMFSNVSLPWLQVDGDQECWTTRNLYDMLSRGTIKVPSLHQVELLSHSDPKVRIYGKIQILQQSDPADPANWFLKLSKVYPLLQKSDSELETQLNEALTKHIQLYLGIDHLSGITSITPRPKCSNTLVFAPATMISSPIPLNKKRRFKDVEVEPRNISAKVHSSHLDFLFGKPWKSLDLLLFFVKNEWIWNLIYSNLHGM
jgi:hypothetical protein